MDKILKLTKGHTAKVSPMDFDAVAEYRWSAVKCGQKYNKVPQVYACRATNRGGVHTRIYLHRYIASLMYSQDPDYGVKTLTFADGNKLNCTRENLILASSRVRRSATQIKKGAKKCKSK
jgi:hypothetical protein